MKKPSHADLSDWGSPGIPNPAGGHHSNVVSTQRRLRYHPLKIRTHSCWLWKCFLVHDTLAQMQITGMFLVLKRIKEMFYSLTKLKDLVPLVCNCFFPHWTGLLLQDVMLSKVALIGHLRLHNVCDPHCLHLSFLFLEDFMKNVVVWRVFLFPHFFSKALVQHFSVYSFFFLTHLGEISKYLSGWINFISVTEKTAL